MSEVILFRLGKIFCGNEAASRAARPQRKAPGEEWNLNRGLSVPGESRGSWGERRLTLIGVVLYP